MTVDLSKGATFRFAIGPKHLRYTFKIVPDVKPNDEFGNPQSTIQAIEVYRGDSAAPSQKLEGCELNQDEPPVRGLDWFHTDDFNFDGYDDLYLMTGAGATGNQYGCVWLYNPVTGHFDYSEEFTKLAEARYWIDEDTKTILTFERGGMAGRVHTALRYKVEKNRPILIWSEWQDWDSARMQFHCVQQERRDGKMVDVLNQWSADGPCDPSRLFE